MLYNLLAPLAEDMAIFNLFRYITFRTGGAVMTALIISFLIGPGVIRWLKAKQAGGNTIREYVPDTHLKKQGTPTMGGLMILFAVTISTLLWCDLSSAYMWIALGVFLGYGMLGFSDDYLKLTRSDNPGLSGRMKLVFQGLIGGVAVLAYVAYSNDFNQATGVAIPFVKDFLVPLGWFFVAFGLVVVVGSSNAVNLTDGLDGLAIGPVMIAAACFGLIAYLVGHIKFANYLQIHYVAGTGELAVMCGAVIGAGLGFLWYNAPPAAVFMGDTGSLAAGGLLGILSVITKHELVLAIIGGLFVVETISVVVQVMSYKLTGKRVFRMAPLHHHFEKKGWPEPTIVIRFWIIAIILALVGLSTLKLR